VPRLLVNSSDDYRFIRTWELICSDVNDPAVNLEPYVAPAIEICENPPNILKSLVSEIICEK
jgi:hypothetical protein